MRHRHQSISIICILGTLFINSLALACRPAPNPEQLEGYEPVANLDRRLSAIVRPYRFSFLKWELRAILSWAIRDRTIPGKLESLLSGRWAGAIQDECALVSAYFSLIDEIGALEERIDTLVAQNKADEMAVCQEHLERLQRAKRALKELVEQIVERQIRETLKQQGIFNPADRHVALGIHFPPINFSLERPPHLLVISPRDRIESLREVMLLQNLSLGDMQEIEARVEALGVSALVVELGGFGATYPTFVADDTSLRFTIEAATEEWLHQYLAFTPLGFRYLLDVTGISRDYGIATMNETLAGMVSEEIGGLVTERYYPQYRRPQRREPIEETAFDFNREMRETRLTVDELLSTGEVALAEQFMEERRKHLVSHGVYIRKLNQAYFAFYGAYADDPTSVDPIGEDMKVLRRQSATLSAFLNAADGLTSYRDLRDCLKRIARTATR